MYRKNTYRFVPRIRVAQFTSYLPDDETSGGAYLFCALYCALCSRSKRLLQVLLMCKSMDIDNIYVCMYYIATYLTLRNIVYCATSPLQILVGGLYLRFIAQLGAPHCLGGLPGILEAAHHIFSCFYCNCEGFARFFCFV